MWVSKETRKKLSVRYGGTINEGGFPETNSKVFTKYLKSSSGDNFYKGKGDVEQSYEYSGGDKEEDGGNYTCEVAWPKSRTHRFVLF